MKFKLGIGLPLTEEKVHTAFLDSWVRMSKPEFVYIRPIFPGKIDEVRNQIVQQALESKCTHLLMMDTDQTFPENTIEKLISHNKDVVAGKVHRRYPPFDPIAYVGERGNYKYVEDSIILNNELIEIDATGCGCVLYNTKVFKKIKAPWFELNHKTDEGRPIGEDILFCQKLKKAGYKIYMDTRLDIGHMSTMKIDWSVYSLYKFLAKVSQQSKEE